MSELTFGVFFPQGWKMELSSIEDPQDKWRHAVDVAVLAEELGYDSLWWYDHFHNVPRPAHETVLECWTTVAAVSQRTSRIQLGQMVGCNGYRNPALLAKMTSTIDVISGGRLFWGIGAGWYEHEFNGYGYDFPAPKDRIGMLREAVEIVKAMWTEPDVTYSGKYYELRGAQCDPKPVQTPHPPIMIGGGGEQLTLRVVARHATHSNFGGKPEEWAHKAEVLQGHCTAVGRDYDEITKTWSPEVFIRETEAEVQAAGSRSFIGEAVESWTAGNLVGTPEQVAEKIRTYVDLGCGGFFPWCSDYPDTTTMRLFAEQVIPHFR
jgi:F420-dependent oxidoreductase-like protein